MRLIGTIFRGSNAWAVYAPEPLTLADFWAAAANFDDEWLAVGPDFRIVQVGDEPPAEELDGYYGASARDR